MRTRSKLAITSVAMLSVAGAWFWVTQSPRSMQRDARILYSTPIEQGSAHLTVDWSTRSHRQAWAQLMLADPSEARGDEQVPMRERKVESASVGHGESAAGELLVRARAQALEAGRTSNRIGAGPEPDDDGWIEFSLTGWPIRSSCGLCVVQLDASAPTRVELEIVRGPEPPAGTAPNLVVDGGWDDDLSEGADVGFAVVNFSFVMTLLLALFASLWVWALKARVAERTEFERTRETSIEARSKQVTRG